MEEEKEKYQIEFELGDSEEIRKDKNGYWGILRREIYCKRCDLYYPIGHLAKDPERDAFICPKCGKLLPAINEELNWRRGIGMERIFKNGIEMLSLDDFFNQLKTN